MVSVLERVAGQGIGLHADAAPDELDALDMATYAELQRLASARWESHPNQWEGTLSAFVEDHLCYRMGRKVSFRMRPWWPEIYNTPFTVRQGDPAPGPESQVRLIDGELRVVQVPSHELLSPTGHAQPALRRPRRWVLLKTARQVEKSSFIGNFFIAITTLFDNLTALYVSSARDNMSEFIEERIDNTIRISPKMQEYVGRMLSFNKLLKRFERTNGKIVARAAHLSADRARGVAGDAIGLDEIQNLVEKFIPILLAVVSNSEMEGGAVRLLAGTPLSFGNPLERYWSRLSTQNVWMMKCSRCGMENPPHREQCTPRGLVCSRCGKGLSPHNGRWITHGAADAPYEGFHISRAVQPYTRLHIEGGFEEAWATFWADLNNPTVDDAAIANELFGLSADSGKRPLTEEQLRACCHPGIVNRRRIRADVLADPLFPVFMGGDWAEGTQKAFSVIAAGYFNGNVFEVPLLYRYMGRESDSQFVREDIAELFEENRVQMMFADAGLGWGIIPDLRDAVSDGLERVLAVRYVHEQSPLIAYDPVGHKFTVHRTRWMAKVFSWLRRGRIRFPRWTDMSGVVRPDGGFSQDMLTIFSEATSGVNPVVLYNHTDADDAFHAVGYALMAALFQFGLLGEFINA